MAVQAESGATQQDLRRIVRTAGMAAGVNRQRQGFGSPM